MYTVVIPAEAQATFDHGIVLMVLFEFLLHIFNHRSDHLDDGNYQRTKRQGSEVVEYGPAI